MATRFMLDTDAIIRLSESPDAIQALANSVESGDVEVLVTRVQVDEFSRVSDPDALARRVLALLLVRARLVLTSVVVLDVSRFGLARWGGIDETAAFDRHVGTGTGRARHAKDATIASAAQAEAAVLVTLNRNDMNRFVRGHPGLRVIGWDEFVVDIASIGDVA